MNIDDLEFDSPLVQGWLTYALNVPQSEFVPREDVATLVCQPFVESKAISGFFIDPEFDPHRRGPSVEWSVHATAEAGVDLIRARYESRDLILQLLEGRTFVFLQATPKDATKALEGGRRAYVTRLVDLLVELSTWSHTWVVDLPPALDDSSRAFMLTNEDAPSISELHNHDDRIDVLIVGVDVGFLFYKRIGQREDFEPAHAWFDDKARATLLQEQSH